MRRRKVLLNYILNDKRREKEADFGRLVAQMIGNTAVDVARDK